MDFGTYDVTLEEYSKEENKAATTACRFSLGHATCAGCRLCANSSASATTTAVAGDGIDVHMRLPDAAVDCSNLLVRPTTGISMTTRGCGDDGNGNGKTTDEHLWGDFFVQVETAVNENRLVVDAFDGPDGTSGTSGNSATTPTTTSPSDNASSSSGITAAGSVLVFVLSLVGAGIAIACIIVAVWGLLVYRRRNQQQRRRRSDNKNNDDDIINNKNQPPEPNTSTSAGAAGTPNTPQQLEAGCLCDVKL